jgi:hypothetical protein
MKNSLLIVFAFAVGLSILMSSCDNNNSSSPDDKEVKGSILTNIKIMEDSLMKMSEDGSNVRNIHKIELINRFLAYYHAFPADEYSAVCLDRVHMIYSGMNVHIRAAAYADTVLMKYPNYTERDMILESLGSIYDIFITPRDTALVRKYYTQLLEEFPKMDEEKREGIKERLRNNNLTFDEYLDKKIKEITAM